MVSLVVPLSPLLSNAVVRFWPIFAVKEVLNVVKSNFRFASESGRSECTSWGRSECLLMAESRRSLTVNMYAVAYFGEITNESEALRLGEH